MNSEQKYLLENPSRISEQICPLGKKRKFKSIKEGYRKGCGPKKDCECLRSLQSSIMRERGMADRMRAGFKAKYGDINPMQLTAVKSKVAETNKKKYGGASPMADQAVRDKIAKTNQERYGSSSALSNSIVKEKIQATNLKRYGKEDVMDIARSSYREQTGLQNPFQDEVIKKKIWDKTWKNKEAHGEKIRAGTRASLGVDYALQSKQVREKLSRTARLNRFGPDVVAKLEDVDWLRSCCMNSYELAINLGVSQTTAWNALFRAGVNLQRNGSRVEDSLAKFIKGLGLEPKMNRRPLRCDDGGVLELDLWLQDHNFAIEHCGNYWHSDSVQGDKNYHVKKLSAARKANIRLVQLFEDEWLTKRSIVENRIKQMLGKNERGPAARELRIEKSNGDTFFDKYHLQGKARGASHCYIAYFGATPVAAMSFGAERGALGSTTRDGIFEMYRFCTDGKSYSGVASRLFATFLRDTDPISVLTFADLRWSSGSVYKSLGFIHEVDTAPNYWYVRNGDPTFRRHRYTFRKQVLVRMGGDPEKTEEQLARDIGLSRIWDCGNARFRWSKHK